MKRLGLGIGWGLAVFLAMTGLAFVVCGGVFRAADGGLINVTEHCYSEEIDSIDRLIRHSTNIVSGKLVAAADFDGWVNEYLFEVRGDYTDNTEREIHVYDAADYIVGHSYFLFLYGSDTALYPHRIYTGVKKDLLLDLSSGRAAGLAGYRDMRLLSRERRLDEWVREAAAAGMVGEALPMAEPVISDEAEIGAVAAGCDVAALVRVSAEQQANRYASSYRVDSLEVVKGDKEFSVTHMILPPGLGSDRAYYVFLKEDPAFAGEYLLFSRGLPVLEATAENRSAVGEARAHLDTSYTQPVDEKAQDFQYATTYTRIGMRKELIAYEDAQIAANLYDLLQFGRLREVAEPQTGYGALFEVWDFYIEEYIIGFYEDQPIYKRAENATNSISSFVIYTMLEGEPEFGGDSRHLLFDAGTSKWYVFSEEYYNLVLDLLDNAEKHTLYVESP